MTLAIQASLGGSGQWWGIWAWLWGVGMGAFLSADLTGAALAGDGAALAVLWVVPLTLRPHESVTRWLPDSAPLGGWAGVRPGVAAVWLMVFALVTVTAHAAAACRIASRWWTDPKTAVSTTARLPGDPPVRS